MNPNKDNGRFLVSVIDLAIETTKKPQSLKETAVTVGHFTQAVRGGAEALALLDRVYQGQGCDERESGSSFRLQVQ